MMFQLLQFGVESVGLLAMRTLFGDERTLDLLESLDPDPAQRWEFTNRHRNQLSSMMLAGA